jgi:3-methyladenine DNA glycosylase AlkD
MEYQSISRNLRKLSSPDKALKAKRYFKTKPGDYSADDVFIGVTTPELRKMAKSLLSLSFNVLKNLLKSEIHEERLLAIIIMVDQYKKSDFQQRKVIFQFFMKYKNRINNWDLVDTSAAAILGEFSIQNHSFEIMNKLIRSKLHWDRRKAIVATHALIKKGELDLTFSYAKMLLQDKEDLMHKATGWMLREAGKRDKKLLKRFIELNGKKMPRTMLRYAIEHFSLKDRKKYLLTTKE